MAVTRWQLQDAEPPMKELLQLSFNHAVKKVRFPKNLQPEVFLGKSPTWPCSLPKTPWQVPGNVSAGITLGISGYRRASEVWFSSQCIKLNFGALLYQGAYQVTLSLSQPKPLHRAVLPPPPPSLFSFPKFTIKATTKINGTITISSTCNIEKVFVKGQYQHFH